MRLAAIRLVMVMAVVVLAGSAKADTVVIADTDASALVVFNEQLDGYGVWVQTADYGLVWVPDESAVGPDFKPYVTNGHWAIQEDGDWVWVSTYPFGWVVFHYGRWTWSSKYGWVWVPGREYSPAWVVWRVPQPGYTYIGWAPAPPIYYWVDGVAVSVWVTPYTPYIFCDSRYLFSYHVHRHIYYRPPYVYRAHRATTPYHPAGARRAPTVERAGVPRSTVPGVRVPARPHAVALGDGRISGVGTHSPARPSVSGASAANADRSVPTRSAARGPAAPTVDRRVSGQPRLDHTVTLPRGDQRADLDMSSGTRSLGPNRPVSRAPTPSTWGGSATPVTPAAPRARATLEPSSSGSPSRSAASPRPSTRSPATTAPSRRSSPGSRPTATPRRSRSATHPPPSSHSTSSGSRAPAVRRAPPSRRR